MRETPRSERKVPSAAACPRSPPVGSSAIVKDRPICCEISTPAVCRLDIRKRADRPKVMPTKISVMSRRIAHQGSSLHWGRPAHDGQRQQGDEKREGEPHALRSHLFAKAGQQHHHRAHACKHEHEGQREFGQDGDCHPAHNSMIRAILPKKIRRQRPPEMIRVAIRAMKAAIASPMKGSRNSSDPKIAATFGT